MHRKYLTLVMPYPEAFTSPFTHISGMFPTHVPIAFSILVFCVLQRWSLSEYYLCLFLWLTYKLQKNTHILIVFTPVHRVVRIAWYCSLESHHLVLNTHTDTTWLCHFTPVALFCDNRTIVVSVYSVVKKARKTCMIGTTLLS